MTTVRAGCLQPKVVSPLSVRPHLFLGRPRKGRAIIIVGPRVARSGCAFRFVQKFSLEDLAVKGVNRPGFNAYQQVGTEQETVRRDYSRAVPSSYS